VAGINFLAGYGLGQLAAAHAQLQSKSDRSTVVFDELVASAVSDVNGPNTPRKRRFVDLARPTLADLINDLGQSAQRDLEDYHNLHQVRIAGKRLRYAMEIFVGCFAQAFREELYPTVETLQEILGRANDSQVAVEHLTQVRDELRGRRSPSWPAVRFGLEAYIRFHRQRLARERKQFQRWWESWQSAGIEARLGELIRGEK
jgi:hypothetical protein